VNGKIIPEDEQVKFLGLSIDKNQNFNSHAVVISKNVNKGALGTTTPIVWVWLSYNHAHIFKDGNIII